LVINNNVKTNYSLILSITHSINHSFTHCASMKQKKQIVNLSTDKIQQYLSGELSRTETHEVEKAMLENTFNNDAVEGFEELRKVKTDLPKVKLDLQNRLQSRIRQEEKAKVLPLWTNWKSLSLAASVALMIGFGTYFWNNSPESKAEFQPVAKSVQAPVLAEKSEPEELAKIETDAPVLARKKEEVAVVEKKAQKPSIISDEVVAASAPTEPEPKLEAEAPPSVQAPVLEEISKNKDKATSAPAPVIAQAKTASKAEDEVSKERRTASEVAVNSAPAAGNYNSSPPIAKAKRSPAPTGYESKTMSNKISGVVIDADNKEPISGVSIFAEQKEIGKTDNAGKFEIDKSAVGKELMLNRNEFESLKITVGDDSQFSLMMQPKTELAIIDLKNNKTWKYNPNNHPAQPSISPDNYQAYLKKNRKKESQSSDTLMIKSVTLDFKVNKDGSLSNFKIIKSAGKTQDEEAIRLIKEGPVWMPKISNNITKKQIVRLVVEF
jgi:outer membrane biosynthesis protein TonB